MNTPKWLIVIEVLICFIPVTSMWSIAVIMFCFQVFGYITGLFPFESSNIRGLIEFVLIILIGVLGYISLLNVFKKIVDPQARVINHKLSLLFASPAIFLLFLGTLRTEVTAFQVFFFLPIISSIHVIYLGRAYLFGFESIVSNEKA